MPEETIDIKDLPKVSIIIPTYKAKTKQYLDACIDAVRNLNYPVEKLDITIISPRTYIPKYMGVKNIHHPRDDRNFAEAVNFGILNSDQSSEHVFLLSDDTIPTKHSLINLVTTIHDQTAIYQGISNCDNYWLYNLMTPITIRDKRFLVEKRFFTIDELGEDYRYLKDSDSVYPPGVIYPQTLCFYACLIPRKVIHKLGLLDENFNTGYEDSDYCHRAKNANIKLGVVMNAMIWHAGGATTNDILTPEITEKNKKLFFEKWR